MTKKWLYGVALGALLIAGNAAGVTVHDVLSNGFWSADAEQRLTVEKLKEAGNYIEIPFKMKHKDGPAGAKIDRWKETTKGGTFFDTRWKDVRRHNSTTYPSLKRKNEDEKLIVRHEFNKEKTLNKIFREYKMLYGRGIITNRYETEQMTYLNKPTKKEGRPAGAFVVADWFPDELTKYKNPSARFFGTEHTAVTNIISDTEAYITGTIYQTCHVDEYRGYEVDEDGSLLRTYTQHITTDENHVYVQQEITEDTHNDPCYDSQNTYQTQYTATFKKGIWKNETETISKVSQRDIAPWAAKMFQNEKF